MIDKLLPLDLTPEAEISRRIQALKKQMAQVGIDGVFLTHRPDYYYFSGSAQDAWLYVTMAHEPLLFVKRYLPRAVAESPLAQIVPVHSVTEIPQIIKDTHGDFPKTMGISFDLVPVRDFRFYQSLFFGCTWQDASPLIMSCRAIKSEYELGVMQEVAKISSRVFDFIAETFEPGIRETDLAGRIEAFARTQGHSGRLQTRHYRSVGFTFHIMGGESGGQSGALDSPVCGTGMYTAFPFGAGTRVIGKNDPVLIDLGTMAFGYHMDESRMFVAGKMTGQADAASQAAIDILLHVKDAMKPGVAMKTIFQSAVTMADRLGYGEQFLGLSGFKSKFLGHGIGLELVEDPIISKGRSTALEPGMVFAVEPKFIFKDRFAAGIESVILITETGSRFLSIVSNKVFAI
ncbi:Xaa-Pro peptidase family protein [uncultured Desulfobacter sp.]|nr:Xaa-Pro peptidase family protein [uncultured Desulfobacter sp.]